LSAVRNRTIVGISARKEAQTMRDAGRIHVEVAVILMILVLAYARAAYLLVAG